MELMLLGQEHQSYTSVVAKIRYLKKGNEKIKINIYNKLHLYFFKSYKLYKEFEVKRNMQTSDQYTDTPKI